MANPDVLVEIDRRQEAAIASTGATGERADLLRCVDDAYRTAERARNAAGMVAALKLRADLIGALRAPELELANTRA